MEKDADAFRTIGEAAVELDLPQHVLRFWETRFSQIRPMKRSGGRRYYRPQDVELLAAIRHLLYGEGYTIKGVQRILKQQGGKGVIELVQQLKGGSVAGGPAAAAVPVMSGGALFASEPDAGRDEAPPVFLRAEAGGPGLPAATVSQLQEILAELDQCRLTLAAARAV